MDIEKILKIVKSINIIQEENRTRNYTFTLIKLRETITAVKNKLEKGTITILVNEYYLKEINAHYGTNFVCKSDEEYGPVINSVINYINTKLYSDVQEEIIKEVAKKLSDKNS